MIPESLPKSLLSFFKYLTSHDAQEISPQDFIDHWFDPYTRN